MAALPTLQDEYQMLLAELRQNRESQLQSLLATPIWIALFFGLLSAGGFDALNAMPALVLVPIPLVFMSLLLVVDRRGSSDRIVAYFRTAFDQKLASEIGWNFLLPEFRRQVKRLRTQRANGYVVPQRPDFTTMVWATNFVIALTCLGLYGGLLPSLLNSAFWVTGAFLLLAYGLVLWWIFRQSAAKTCFVEAWRVVLQERAKSG
jgi:hypothetical protein